MSERYEGWANRETWAVSLYLNNDQGMQEMAILAIVEADRSGESPAESLKERVETLLVREQYLDEFGEDQPLELSRIASDIGSLWRVDWHEASRSFLDDLEEVTV